MQVSPKGIFMQLGDISSALSLQGGGKTILNCFSLHLTSRKVILK